MKKISILTGCLFTVALSSCNFLDREPLDAIGKDQFLQLQMQLLWNNIVMILSKVNRGIWSPKKL